MPSVSKGGEHVNQIDIECREKDLAVLWLRYLPTIRFLGNLFKSSDHLTGMMGDERRRASHEDLKGGLGGFVIRWEA